MPSTFESFSQSSLDAFIESPLRVRGAGAGQFWIFGGGVGQRENESYRPDAWTSRAPVLGNNSGANPFSAAAGIYAFHSVAASTTNFLSRYVLDDWTVKTPRPGAFTSGAGAFTVGGKGYVFGGRVAGPTGTFVRTNREYTPETDSWAVRTSYSADAGAVGTTTIDGRGYAWGGAGNDPVTLSPISFDRNVSYALDAWTGHTPLPGKRGGQMAWTLGDAGFHTGGIKFVVGDPNNPVVLDRTERFTGPGSGTWTFMADLIPPATSSGRAEAMAGAGHVIAGNDRGATFQDHARYVVDVWSKRAPDPILRTFLGGGVL